MTTNEILHNTYSNKGGDKWYSINKDVQIIFPVYAIFHLS